MDSFSPKKLEKPTAPSVEIVAPHPAKMDVIVPLGPHEEEILRNLPLSLVLPRALFPIGGRPILWHVLNQLSLIEGRINKIYLCVNESSKESTWNFLKNYEKIYNLSDIDEKLKQKIEIKTYKENYNNLILEIIRQQSKGLIFHHLHDIIFPTKNGAYKAKTRQAYADLIESHVRADSLVGTLLVSDRHNIPFGYVAHEKGNIIEFSEREGGTSQVRTVALHPESPVSVSTHMGVGIFDSGKLYKILELYNRNPNVYFYDVLATAIGSVQVTRRAYCESYSFRCHVYGGRWFHVDNLHELRDINSSYTDYF